MSAQSFFVCYVKEVPMKNNVSSSYILFEKDKKEFSGWYAAPITSLSQVSSEGIKNGDFLVYSKDEKINFKKEYLCVPINLPYKIRDALIKQCNKDHLYKVADELVGKYINVAKTINEVLLYDYEDVYIFCNIHNYDFCLVLTSDYDIEFIENKVNTYIEHMFMNSEESIELSKINLEIHKLKRLDCIRSGRQFVKYNPNYKEYFDIMNTITKIECDSFDRQAELSLFSNLILKDLVETTHLYWMHESGEIRQMLSDENQILSERDDIYFKYFRMFCYQAQDSFVYHDWIWCLIFLTSTLLSALKYRTIDMCKNKTDIYEHKNFFGFVPVIEDAEKSNSEVMSLFTRHISRNFCHGFLAIPSDSLYDLPEYLPAYIHEFFHYIPPVNRFERNKAIFELALHSLLFDLRNKLSKKLYDDAIDFFSEELINTISDFGFDKTNLFDCDSMEYLDRIKNIFIEANFSEIYDSVFIKLFKKHNRIDLFDVFRASKRSCVNKFEDSSISVITAFTSFFREIRSDIAMCSFFDIDTEKYIRIFAEEPLFAVLPRESCADSTIMRFGFMCRYLQNIVGQYKPNWIKECCEIIDKLINRTENISEYEKKKYLNLKGYLIEYEDLTIEANEGAYAAKGTCFLENFIVSEKILSVWEQKIKHYSQHNFSKEIQYIYKTYMEYRYPDSEDNSKALECSRIICGIRLLFRDLYSYNGELDLDK